MDDLTSVWSVPAAVGALVAGIGFGYLVIAAISHQPRWRTPNSPVAYGWLVGLLGAWCGLAFYAAEIAAALLQGDPLWLRILSRYGMWLVMSFGLGVGTWAGLRRATR